MNHQRLPAVWCAAAMLVLVLVTVGCSRAPQAKLPTVVSGTSEQHVNVDGRTRDYRLYVPPNMSGEPIPLVIVLHGGGGSGQQVEELSGMDSVADAHGFLVAYPDGTSGPGGGFTWNGGECCGAAMRQNVDDVGFISALIDALISERNVDPDRVYVTGISNGGIMAHRIGCELSEKVAAIAPIAAALMLTNCTPARPVSVLMFHGGADRDVPEQGGFNPQSGARTAFPPLSQTVETWRTLHGCSGPATVIYQQGLATCTSFGGCSAGAEVVLCRIEGGGHTWPGGKVVLPDRLGPTSTDVSASSEMWDFFKRHPRVQAIRGGDSGEQAAGG